MPDLSSNQDDAGDVPELPPKLVDELAGLYQSPGSVSGPVDQAILNRARAQLAGIRRPHRGLRWMIAAVAVAACVLIIGRMSTYGPISPNDIDGNHRVDIVDALKLAHRVQVGAGRDINGDGVIDQRDVDAIAMSIVQIGQGGGVQ